MNQPSSVREDPHSVPQVLTSDKDQVPQDGDTQSYTVLVRNERNLTVYTATLTFAGIWLSEDEPPVEEAD